MSPAQTAPKRAKEKLSNRGAGTARESKPNKEERRKQEKRYTLQADHMEISRKAKPDLKSNAVIKNNEAKLREGTPKKTKRRKKD